MSTLTLTHNLVLFFLGVANPWVSQPRLATTPAWGQWGLAVSARIAGTWDW